MLPAKSSAVVLAAAVVARIELPWQAGRQEGGLVDREGGRVGG